MDNPAPGTFLNMGWEMLGKIENEIPILTGIRAHIVSHTKDWISWIREPGNTPPGHF